MTEALAGNGERSVGDWYSELTDRVAKVVGELGVLRKPGRVGWTNWGYQKKIPDSALRVAVGTRPNGRRHPLEYIDDYNVSARRGPGEGGIIGLWRRFASGENGVWGPPGILRVTAGNLGSEGYVGPIGLEHTSVTIERNRMDGADPRLELTVGSRRGTKKWELDDSMTADEARANTVSDEGSVGLDVASMVFDHRMGLLAVMRCSSITLPKACAESQGNK